MERSFLSAATAAKIGQLRERGWSTVLAVGNAVDLVVWRDLDGDGENEALPAQRVVIVWPQRQAQEQASQATAFTAGAGEFQKWAPFDVRRGDRFLLPNGQSGSVTGVPFTDGGIVHAAFEIES